METRGLPSFELTSPRIASGFWSFPAETIWRHHGSDQMRSQIAPDRFQIFQRWFPIALDTLICRLQGSQNTTFAIIPRSSHIPPHRLWTKTLSVPSSFGLSFDIRESRNRKIYCWKSLFFIGGLRPRPNPLSYDTRSPPDAPAIASDSLKYVHLAPPQLAELPSSHSQIVQRRILSILVEYFVCFEAIWHRPRHQNSSKSMNVSSKLAFLR